MRQNAHIQLATPRCLLVPYERHHVEKYHAWMQEAELQFLTASEPLTLEEEYEMQASWREDEDKLTFIVLEKKDEITMPNQASEVESMIGDVNIFLGEAEGEDGEPLLFCELDVMIAERSARGNGIGGEISQAMIGYAAKELKRDVFYVKINHANLRSSRLFERLGFQFYSDSEVFQERTYKLAPEALETVKKYYEDNVQEQTYPPYPT